MLVQLLWAGQIGTSQKTGHGYMTGLTHDDSSFLGGPILFCFVQALQASHVAATLCGTAS